MTLKKKEKYRAAVVGCGRIGMMMEQDPKRPKPATHTGAFGSHPRLELVALVDLDPAKKALANKLYPQAQFFTDAEKVLREIKPDVVSIASFHSAHHPLVLLAAKYKVPVIVCEKPIADTISAGQEMIGACKKSGSKLVINHIRRFDPLLREWAEKIKSGLIGEIQQATGWYGIGLYHMGTHLVDFIRFYLGDVEWVSAWENRRAHTAIPGDWCVDGILGLKSGGRVILQSVNVKDYSMFELRVLGTKGEVFVRDLGRAVEFNQPVSSKQYDGFHELHLDGRQIFPAQNQVLFRGLTNHVVDILDGKSESVSTGEDSLCALEVLATLRQSGENDGKKIFL